LDESEWLKNNPLEMYKYARDRYENPDLFLTGALNASPERSEDGDGPFDYFDQISSRAWSLGDNSKIHSFVGAATLVDRQLGFLLNKQSSVAARDKDFLRGVVNAAVLPIFPTDVQHLNKTFAFCKTTGLTSEKVLGSVADGCFQTFKTLSDAVTSGPDAIRRSLLRLHAAGRIPILTRIKTRVSAKSGETNHLCPFFASNGKPFGCPFAEANQVDVHELCTQDPAHQER
jgi:hypothetical protein